MVYSNGAHKRPGDQRVLILLARRRGLDFLPDVCDQSGPAKIAGNELIAITLTTVTASILLHGISVTPLMSLYTRRKARRTR
jgi:NhaP-type Na+/H+ or K+/H+ antiporter